MLPTSANTHSHIELWAETVALQTADTTAPAALAPTSSNPRLRKHKPTLEPLRVSLERTCKRSKAMADVDPVEDDGGSGQQQRPRQTRASGRLRGRPRGSGRGRRQINNAEGVSFTPPPAVFDAPTLLGSSLPTRPSSPRKRGKDVNQPRTDASIDIGFLASCTPSVLLRSRREIRQRGELPQRVDSLYTLLNETPDGFIPARLKASYDADANTPRKTRDPPLKKHFTSQESWIPSSCLEGLKTTVDQVMKMAARNHRTGAHERQWGATTIQPLINEVLKWSSNQQAVLLNVESCSIEPSNFRMVRPNKLPLGGESHSDTSKASTEIGDITASRMVDLALGLDLDEIQTKTVADAFNSMMDNEHSLNQSLSYIRWDPIFLDIELKKTVSNRDPTVQLAIWLAAAYSKRKWHGWDTSIPMPGIVVNGHEWQCYVTFVRDNGLIMMGPLAFGSTKDINGTYEIVYKLNSLIQWGTTEYKEWFDATVLASWRERATTQGV